MTPEWVAKMPVGHWFAISGDHPNLGLAPTPHGTRYLADNNPADDRRLNPARGIVEKLRRKIGKPARAQWLGRSGFSAITEAWNGAVFASRFGDSGSMLVFGGGHDDYFGSDVHAFDLQTRQWRRVSDGYVYGNSNDYGQGALYSNAEYPDGSPLPPHTYNYCQYDQRNNDYILFKGQLELGPRVKAAAIPHMLNLDNLTWRRGRQHPSAILNSAGCTTWDENRQKMWGNSGDAGGGNAFLGFDPAGENEDGSFGRWTDTHPSKLTGEADHNAMAFDPIHDIIVVAVAARNELCAIDPSHPEGQIKRLQSTGDRPRLQEFSAIEYARNLGTFVYYSAADGAAIHQVHPPDGYSWADMTNGVWTWESRLRDGSLDPVAHAENASQHAVSLAHTFGRFRIASYDVTDVAILVRHVDSPVYAIRLV